VITATKRAREVPTAAKWTISDSFFELVCEAIFRDSLRIRRFSTVRTTIVEGLDIAIRATTFERFLFLKALTTLDYQGDHTIHIQFSPDERRLLVETRRLLSDQSLDRIMTADTLALAIVAHRSAYK
jgi:hypothetical protein